MGFGDMMGKVGKGIAKYGPELLQRGASGVYAGRTGDIPGAQRMNSNYAMQKRAQAMQAELSQLGDLNAATLPKVGEIMLKHGFQDKYMDVVAMVQKGEDQKFRHNLATAEFGQKERELNMEMLDAGRPDEQHYAALRRDAWKEVSTYKQREASWATVDKSQDTAMGDLALINAYVKVIDPGSVVRTEEGKMIVEGGGVPLRIKNWISNLTGGGRLSPQQAQEIRNQARAYIMHFRGRHRLTMSGWDDIAGARQFGERGEVFPTHWYMNKPIDGEGEDPAASSGAPGSASNPHVIE